MAGYVYLIKIYETIANDIYKFGRTKREFIKRFTEYPKEAKPKTQLVLWHEDIKSFETDVLRELRNVFQERKDIGNEYFQGDVEQMKQLIVCHFIPSIVNNNVNNLLRELCKQQQVTNAKVQVVQDMCDMFNYDIIRDDIITYLNTSELISTHLQNFNEDLQQELQELKDDILDKDEFDEVKQDVLDIKSDLEEIQCNVIDKQDIVDVKDDIIKYLNNNYDYKQQELTKSTLSLFWGLIDSLCNVYPDTKITHRIYDYITFVIDSLHSFFSYLHAMHSSITILYTDIDDFDLTTENYVVPTDLILTIVAKLTTIKEIWRVKVDVQRTTFGDFKKIIDSFNDIGCFVNYKWDQCQILNTMIIDDYFAFKTVIEDVPSCLDSTNEIIQEMIIAYHTPCQKIDVSKPVTNSHDCFLRITPENLVQETINFHKNHNLTNTDIIETIQEMLDSKHFVLSEDFTKSKLNFDEANTYFLSVVSPKAVKKDALRDLLFKSNGKSNNT
jgi:hypothetical protein